MPGAFFILLWSTTCRTLAMVTLRVGGKDYGSTKNSTVYRYYTILCAKSADDRVGKTRNRPRPRISEQLKDGECRWRRSSLATSDAEGRRERTGEATFIIIKGGYLPRGTNPPRSKILTAIILFPQRFNINDIIVLCLFAAHASRPLSKIIIFIERAYTVQRIPIIL